jgi:autotransporter-associated beta strand protein
VNLGTGALSFNGGTLEALTPGGGITSSKAVTLNAGGGTFSANTGTSSILSGVISGSGSFTKDGPGTLTLTGVNTYCGGTTVGSGTLQIGNGGTAGSITGNVTDTGVLAFDRSDSVTFAGVISGTGSVTQIGTGTTILTGTNTYSGGTSISAGTLQVGNGGTTGSIAGNVTDNSVLAFDRSDSVTFAGVISGTGSVTQIGTGTTILSGTNTYSGGTTISAGTLQAGSSTALSQNSAFTVDSTLDLHGFNGTIGSLSGTGAVLNNGATAVALTVGNDNASTTFSGVLENGTGALQLTKTGTGTLTLTGANTSTGGTSISAGTLQLGNGGTTGSITGNVTDNGTLAFDRSNTVTFAGAVSGTGSVTQIGTGTTILSGTNTYSGGTTISAGTLQAGSGTALSQNSAFTVNSTLDLLGSIARLVRSLEQAPC